MSDVMSLRASLGLPDGATPVALQARMEVIDTKLHGENSAHMSDEEREILVKERIEHRRQLDIMRLKKQLMQLQEGDVDIYY